VFSFMMTVLIYLRNKIISFRYPERAKQSLHHTNVYVPASVAALLEVKPQLIAPATVAFCDRDLIDSKVIKICYKYKEIFLTVFLVGVQGDEIFSSGNQGIDESGIHEMPLCSHSETAVHS
jgi:SGT1 protein